MPAPLSVSPTPAGASYTRTAVIKSVWFIADGVALMPSAWLIGRAVVRRDAEAGVVFLQEQSRTTGSHILATPDESIYQPVLMGKNLGVGADHPIAWPLRRRIRYRRGRMFYSAIGHRPEMASEPICRRMLTNAVDWAAGHDGRRGPA